MLERFARTLAREHKQVSWSEAASLRECLFFFSSRRRHTRLQGDWSSDVCSSDLRSPPRRARGCASMRTREPPDSQMWLDTTMHSLEPGDADDSLACFLSFLSGAPGDRKSVCRERV